MRASATWLPWWRQPTTGWPRQALTHTARRVFAHARLGELTLLYDVSHNLAKTETHVVDGRERVLCVHRKGGDPRVPAVSPRVAG